MTIQGRPQTGDKTGYGVLYPLRFVGGDFEAGTGFALAKSSAEIILEAQAASEDGKVRGEFPANHRLGTQMRRYVHKNLRGIFDTVMRAAGMEGIAELDPRIILDPAKFDILRLLDRRVRIRVGIRSDPEYTGESEGGAITVTL